MKTKDFLFILILALGTGFKAFAQVDVQQTQELILPVDVSEPVLSAETTQKILPQKIEPGQTGQSVIMAIIDNSFSFWWNNSDVKTTALGQMADQVDKNLKAEVNLGKSADQKTEHKLSVKFLAMQALAKIEYKGWVRAGLNYDARAAKTQAEMVENISDNKDLVVSQSFAADENRSQVAFLWNW